MAQIRIAEENVYKCMYKASCFPRYNRTSGQQEPIKLEVLANSADLVCEESVLWLFQLELDPSKSWRSVLWLFSTRFSSTVV